jgi:hypothetical protein
MSVILFQTTEPELIRMIESGNAISVAYYKDYCLKPLFNYIRKRRLKSDLYTIKFHHDNAKPHKAKDIKRFPQEQGAVMMSYHLILLTWHHQIFGYLKR